jgi:hypothetical protein
MTKGGSTQNIKPVNKFIFRDQDNKLATFVDWQDQYSTLSTYKQINDFISLKFISVSTYNDTFVINSTEFTQVQ